MNYIVMTGEIQNGKTTVTNILLEELPHAVSFETGEVITEVANAMNSQLNLETDIRSISNMNLWIENMPPILKSVANVDVSVEDLQFSYEQYEQNPKLYQKLFEFAACINTDPQKAAVTITPATKEQYRSELQWIGGYCAKKISPIIWFDELILRSQLAEQEGAEHSILNALRFPAEVPAVKKVGAHIVKILRPGQVAIDKTDITEQEADRIEADTTIINNGSLADLTVVTKEFASDYMCGKPLNMYIATRD